MQPLIWTIVLNWNNYHDTRECIESIRRSTQRVTKIVIIDNGSTDSSFTRLREDYENDSLIYLIRNEANLGFARGVNVGIRYALNQGADFILLVNNDAVLDPDCIRKLVTVMQKNPAIGLAGPRILYFNDRHRIWQGASRFSLLKSWVCHPEANKKQNRCALDTKEVTCLTGCVMLIARRVLEDVGLFDEDFFMYGEDVDFCLRALKAGWSMVHVPSAKAWHKIRSTSKDRTSPFVMYHRARSRILFLRKHFAAPYLYYALLVHIFVFTPYRFFQIMCGTRSLRSIWAWLRGTWDGLWFPLQQK